jgi:hypothetical protein
LLREVANRNQHIDATRREPQQSARHVSPHFHPVDDEEKWHAMESRDRSGNWQKVNVTADHAVESIRRDSAEHVTEISDLSAGAFCTKGELSRKLRWHLHDDPWQRNDLFTRLVLTKRCEQISVELGDSAAASECVGDKREQLHAAAPWTKRAQPRSPRCEKR